MQPNYDDTTCFPPGHLGEQHTGTSKAVYRQEKLSEQLESEDVRTMPFSGNQSYIPWTVPLQKFVMISLNLSAIHGAVLLRNLKQIGTQTLRNSHSYFPDGAPCQYCTSLTQHCAKFLKGQRWRRHFFEGVKPSQSQAPRKRCKRFTNYF